MFEVNDLNLLKVNQYYSEMENFYKNPDEVIDLLNKIDPKIHKWSEKGSLNTVKFLDCRHEFFKEEFKKVEKKLYKLLNGDFSNIKGKIQTNYIKFFNIKDEYKNNYWAPHLDNNNSRYNCIIYLNKNSCDGTNLYNRITKSVEIFKYNEHEKPWEPRKHYELICNIKSKFNKLVVFKSDIYHGLAYNKHKFKNKFRKNQVIFIKQKNG